MPPAGRSRSDQKRWAWWDQTREVIAVCVGVGVAIVETWRGEWDIPALVVILSCLGVIGFSQVARWLTGNGRGNGGS